MSMNTQPIANQLTDLISNLQRRILVAKNERLWSREDLALVSQIHLNTIARFLSGGNLGLETLLILAKGVDALEGRTRKLEQRTLTKIHGTHTHHYLRLAS